MSNVRAAVLVLLAILQMVSGFAPGLFGVQNGVGEMVEPYRTPLVPAGWAFAIWGLIYLGGLVFALFHAVNRKDEALVNVGWLASLAFLGNTVWVLHQPTYGPGWASFIGLELLLLAALAAAFAWSGDTRGGFFRTVSSGTLFALAGWITAASPAGLSLAMVFSSGWDTGPEPTAAMLPILLGWLPIAWSLTWLARRWFFTVPVLWGLFGAAMANLEETRFAAGILAVATSFIGLTLLAKSRARARQSAT